VHLEAPALWECNGTEGNEIYHVSFDFHLLSLGELQVFHCTRSNGTAVRACDKDKLLRLLALIIELQGERDLHHQLGPRQVIYL
jgi:hypothetical protein